MTIQERLPGPRGRANLDHLRRLLVEPAAVLDELAATYGTVVGLGGGPMRVAIVGDPGALRELFSRSTDSFQWGHRFNVLGFVVGPQSMIVSDGPDHRRRRASVQAAFSRRRLNGWIPMIVARTDAAIDSLTATLGGERRRVDLYPVGRALVLDIVIRTLFGTRLAGRATEIGALFERPQAYLESTAIHQLPHPFPFGERPRVRADRAALDRIIDAELAERRRHPSGDPLDVLEVLAQDASVDDAEIRDQVVTLVGAGYDTTAASLAWLLWCASSTPGLWHRLADEASTVLGDVGHAPPNDASLAKLTLANHTMRETLRLHPVGVLSPRRALTDIDLAGHRITRGTMVLWSAHLAGRDPRSWPDPLRFDPDRFDRLTADEKLLSDQAWVPFGRGARACIGFALAQMELTLGVSRLAQRLILDPGGAPVPPPAGLVVNRPAGGAPLWVTSRADPAPAPPVP